MDKIRVLVVDDSAFMRKMISDMINSQVDMQVVDTAKNGEDAINKAKSLMPDVVTLDVEMPKVNGLEALKEIKKIQSIQVIMLSSLTFEGSKTTIEALYSGAFDFIQKPSGSISLDIEKVKNELCEKVRYAKHSKKRFEKVSNLKTESKREDIVSNADVLTTRQRDISSIKTVKIDSVLLGASTGGPRVLYDIITKFPKDLGVPVLVVQHMPQGFTKAFAERLDKNSSLKVVEAKDGEQIQKNTVYIAPGGYHMLVRDGKIVLDLSPSIHGVRPAVDKLFISAGEYYKGNTLCSIFTGMGKDGAQGVKFIKSLGGYVISQDEETSIVYGMPKAAFETGCVDEILPDYKIAEKIIDLVRR
ncbi:two-component system, chemotaxis family, response regulator CheB [Caloramator quimbayensis]|uniref:Protein-glutamate methylesterase/protein-glutamine glutaminase n=1 Tax=Caloramator quimbayensis TaxID=1147123 RepID=A0A1T4X941_9CLOT|nr:chemotaxis response regulator protein-glutamate methylesterase [Caloramator quimbayensis]SKA86106.1 two-component system, chemotaxis family, response regulator CheB [Caloramator quimbayensis]